METHTSPRLQVLHLMVWLTTTSPGGIRTYLECLSRALKESRVGIAAGALMPGTPPAYITALHLGRRASSKVLNAYRFWKWLRHAVKKSDVVHIHNFFDWTFSIGAITCLLAKKPYVVSPHGALDPWFLNIHPTRKKLYIRLVGRPLLQRSAAIIVTAPPNVTAVERICPGLNVVLAPPGIPVRSISESRASYQALRAPILKVIYVGRMEPVKDLPCLFTAMATMLQQGQPVNLDILGTATPSYLEQLKHLVGQLDITQAVTFRGYIEGADKLALMHKAHVLALPSHAENFSFATAEALAEGLPVVVTTGVALSEVITRYQCGSVIAPGDSRALAEALTAFSDPELRSTSSIRANQCAQKEFSIERMRSSLEQVYQNAVEHPAGGND